MTITAGIASPTPVVLASAAPYSDAFCTTPAGSGTFTGKIVVCERGGNARVDKGYNVLQGGASGFILYNVAVSDLETDSHLLPAIHVNDPSSTIAAFVTGHTGVKATWAAGVLQSALGDEMASFSSRGPLGDFIKPDITAPGVQIFAGNSFQHLFDPVGGLGPNGENYQAIAGTSMATPHSAGTALLLKAAHPKWTPGQIKSAEMTSAVHDVVKEDGVTPADPFDDGAGAIRVNRAVMPTVTFDVPAVDYYQASSDPLNWINLNLPSIDAADMQGVVTTTRTAKNVTGKTQTLILSASGPSHSITVSPSKLVIPANQSATFTVRIDASKLSDGQYFGSITLNPKAAGALNAVLPVAFNKQPSSNVTFTNTCDSTSLLVGTSTNCEASATNMTNNPANVTMRVHAQNSRIKVGDYSPATRYQGNGFLWSGTLSPAIAPAIVSMTAPGDGFLDISSGFGSLPVTATDESIQNWTVDPFNFGGETYNTIGVVSDGYLVLGGGTSADVNFVPQNLPDPNVPNNVLAPYWTDLNPTFGGHIWINELTDGTNLWVVVEYQAVDVYTSLQPRTFEVWIQTNAGPGGERITFEYSQTGPSGEAGGLVVGAENRDGTSGVELSTPAVGTPPALTGYRIVAGTPTPGGTMSIDYTVTGRHVGTSNLLA
ncbi:MAG TPA: S8 family serine peptidase, partial [Candidatus Limnocylindrales bacterium]